EDGRALDRRDLDSVAETVREAGVGHSEDPAAAWLGWQGRADRASGQDRVRRPELPGPRRGAGGRASDRATPLREVAERVDRARRPDRHSPGRDKVRLRGRARRRPRHTRAPGLEGERAGGGARGWL